MPGVVVFGGSCQNYFVRWYRLSQMRYFTATYSVNKGFVLLNNAVMFEENDGDF